MIRSQRQTQRLTNSSFLLEVVDHHHKEISEEDILPSQSHSSGWDCHHRQVGGHRTGVIVNDIAMVGKGDLDWLSVLAMVEVVVTTRPMQPYR